MSLRETIWGDIDPYEDVDALIVDIQGWRMNHPILNKSAENAALIAEVGVWKGASCIDMAQANPYAEILAVDTWRGNHEHWLRDQWKKDVKEIDLYSLFRSNVVHKGLQNNITPLPMDSINAYEVCKAKKLEFDLVHIDAGHDFMSCYSDLVNWSEVAKVLVVDDYQHNFPDVDRAVETFVSKGKWWVKWSEDGKALLEPVETLQKEALQAALEGGKID